MEEDRVLYPDIDQATALIHDGSLAACVASSLAARVE